ncbi:rCG32305 [Rattus norvegicus]|uniref:RCG32305 n=1 Tax=Rattus norvegicus TaxID=10116 RepID=A6JXQ4_RAT|nr:rCG32305 [Rattus norvegicus]
MKQRQAPGQPWMFSWWRGEPVLDTQQTWGGGGRSKQRKHKCLAAAVTRRRRKAITMNADLCHQARFRNCPHDSYLID